jgi:hypothetical protein
MAKPRNHRTAKKSKGTKLIFIPPADSSEDIEYDDDESGMFLDKADVQLIYNALRAYKPTGDEAHLHGIRLESFEEILVCEYGDPYPDAN